MPKIKDATEQKIVEYLSKNGPSFMGEVVKELKLSYTRGHNHINNLVSKGIIRHSDPPLQFEVNNKTR